jgi:hypothetical protein
LIIFDSNGKQLQHVTKKEQEGGSVHCTACNRDISVKSIGAAAIIQHQRTGMHKNAIAKIESVSTGRGNVSTK